MNMNYQVDEKGYYGRFGGAYIPEILHKCVEDLRRNYLRVLESESFREEYRTLLRDYVGRPSPLYFARRLSERYGCRIYLKREDLNHTGAHKINNVLGQALLAKKMGKTRLIAETGAGQHGVATATAAALMGMECVVFMGVEDTERQALNVYRMRLLGAEVIPVSTGTGTLKDACSAAFREWTSRIDNYLAGSPMAGQGYNFAVAAWNTGVDPRWSPAIACIESTKGAYCANSYNAWGWSARGGGWRSFGSWSEGISAHVAYLGANYGSTLTPAAAKKYCPPTWQDWYNKVAAQMNRI